MQQAARHLKVSLANQCALSGFIEIAHLDASLKDTVCNPKSFRFMEKFEKFDFEAVTNMSQVLSPLNPVLS